MEFIFCKVDSEFYILFQTLSVFRLNQSPASYYKDPGWNTGHSTWGLWWMKWEWGRSCDVGFPLSMPLHQCFILILYLNLFQTERHRKTYPHFNKSHRLQKSEASFKKNTMCFPLLVLKVHRGSSGLLLFSPQKCGLNPRVLWGSLWTKWKCDILWFFSQC